MTEEATPRESPGRQPLPGTDRSRAEVVPFPRSRRLIVDIGRATRSRRTISGFLEGDVTEVRRRLLEYETATGQEMSFTAYVATCVGRAVADRQVHALRDLRGRLVQYDDVDINVSVEVQVDDRSFPMNHVIRAADKRSVPDISDEMHRIKRHPEPYGPRPRRSSPTTARCADACVRNPHQYPANCPGAHTTKSGTRTSIPVE